MNMWVPCLTLAFRKMLSPPFPLRGGMRALAVRKNEVHVDNYIIRLFSGLDGDGDGCSV